MINGQNYYRINQIKSSLEGVYTILTNGSKKIANIAIVSNVEAIKNNNDLILQITGNKQNSADGIVINIEGMFFNLSFKVVSSDICKNTLESYMICNENKINSSYELFEFCRFRSKVKQTRISTTGGTFLDWYNYDRVTTHKIFSYDGIWISGKYIRVTTPVPPSLEFNISEVLFERFNDSNIFTSVGSYINLFEDEPKEFITVNGIVVPGMKSYKSVKHEEIIAVDEDDKEFSIYFSKRDISENIA